MRDFYTSVVGWTAHDVEREGGEGSRVDYALRTPGGTEVSGIVQALGTHEALPPVWLIHLPVGDLAHSLERTVEGGGEVVHERRGPDIEPAYAVIRDPVGAHLALVQA